MKADQLSIADDPKFSNSPFIQAKSLEVGVELLPLIFSKQLHVTNLRIDHPEITLLRGSGGAWNFSSLGNPSVNRLNRPAQADEKKASSTPANLSVAKLDVVDGTVTVGSMTGKRKPIVYEKVNVAVRNFSSTSQFPVTSPSISPGAASSNLTVPPDP